MLYLITSKPETVLKIESGETNYNDYEYYDISTYEVRQTSYYDTNYDSSSDSDDDQSSNVIYKPLNKYTEYNENDIYVYMVEKNEVDKKDYWEWIPLKNFSSFVTKAIIRTLETDLKEVYDCQVMLDGSTTQDEYRCRKVKDYKKRIYDDVRDKRQTMDCEYYNSWEDAEPKLIKTFIRERISVDTCNGKYVTFGTPKFIRITEDDEWSDSGASHTSIVGNFKIIAINV